MQVAASRILDKTTINQGVMISQALKTLIIDYDEDFRRLCRNFLSSDLDVSVTDCDETLALEALQADLPDVVIIGPNLKVQHRSQLVKLIGIRWPASQALLLNDHPADAETVNQLGASAVGIMACEDMARFLVKAVKKINEGEAWVPRKFVPSLVERLRVQM